MKNLLVAALFLLAMTGCDNSGNPVEAPSAGEAEYSELSMYTTAVATDAEYAVMRADSLAHDSLRHGKMLGTLKRHLGLTDAQVESVKVYGKTLFEKLQGIRLQVRDSVLTKESARSLIQAARDEFIASLTSILTDEQKELLDGWIERFWDRRHGGGGRPGRPHGPHGPHGPGGRP
ncbi:MAG: hypothetical protein F9K22_08895 [Bacteroidetes bacterium]|nr:MAG: hypothetical protein F9K22_08895 [Bacteroidota bacterium]